MCQFSFVVGNHVMSTAQHTARRDANISLRIQRPLLDLIDNAAELAGKSRTQFVLESAKQHAIDVLLDQRFFSLPDAQFKAFMRALDHPAEPTKNLKELMASKAPWEK
jgi:uncharacterized protein (DUF1778 family)